MTSNHQPAGLCFALLHLVYFFEVMTCASLRYERNYCLICLCNGAFCITVEAPDLLKSSVSLIEIHSLVCPVYYKVKA